MTDVATSNIETEHPVQVPKPDKHGCYCRPGISGRLVKLYTLMVSKWKGEERLEQEYDGLTFKIIGKSGDTCRCLITGKRSVVIDLELVMPEDGNELRMPGEIMTDKFEQFIDGPEPDTSVFSNLILTPME